MEMTTGLHVVAVLKNEQHNPMDDFGEYAFEEWESLVSKFGECVRLWRGYLKAIAA